MLLPPRRTIPASQAAWLAEVISEGGAPVYPCRVSARHVTQAQLWSFKTTGRPTRVLQFYVSPIHKPTTSPCGRLIHAEYNDQYI